MPQRIRIISAEVPEPPAERWSNCLRVGDTVFVSGMTARSADGQSVLGVDAYTQSKAIFAKIKHLIVAAGGEIDDVAKLTIYVTDIKDNVGVWKARAEFFSGHFPTSTLVQVAALASPVLLVEIDAVAMVEPAQ